MCTVITASTYYLNSATTLATINSILLAHNVVDSQLAGHLLNILYKQHTDKCDLAATASAV